MLITATSMEKMLGSIICHQKPLGHPHLSSAGMSMAEQGYGLAWKQLGLV